MHSVETASAMAGKIERDFFGGSIRLHILHHATKGEVFGQGLMDELQHHGYRLSPGTLYPILHALERGGYLRSELKRVEARIRRIYLATAAGNTALNASSSKVIALFHAILGDQDGSTKSAEPIRKHCSPRPPAPAPAGACPAKTQGTRQSEVKHSASSLGEDSKHEHA